MGNAELEADMKPDERADAKTKAAIDAQGWLHSGDKGKIDHEGLLSITGRYKELLITAGGENIAPVPTENAIKDFLGGAKAAINSVVMVADKKKFCSVIFVLKTVDGVDGDKPIATDKLAKEALEIDPDCKTVLDACGPDFKGTAKWNKYLLDGCVAYNKSDACTSNAAKIMDFRIS